VRIQQQKEKAQLLDIAYCGTPYLKGCPRCCLDAVLLFIGDPRCPIPPTPLRSSIEVSLRTEIIPHETVTQAKTISTRASLRLNYKAQPLLTLGFRY
jgi:hypothetical protein